MSDEQKSTDFETKCGILSELWLNERDNEDFKDFINYNDLGLPLAYAISSGIVEETDKARGFVEEAWDLLIGSYGLEDTGFESLDDILAEGIDFEGIDCDYEDEEDEE